jgi:hypothetical protein
MIRERSKHTAQAAYARACAVSLGNYVWVTQQSIKNKDIFSNNRLFLSDGVL